MGERNEIGARIRELREKHGMTQTELAEKLFISRETVNMWERGARDIKSGTIVALAETLETTCDYLLRGIDTENISICEELGLTNSALRYLRYLSDSAASGEWDEQSALIALNGILSSEYASIIEDIFTYATADFSKPLLRQKTPNKRGADVVPFSNHVVLFDMDIPSELKDISPHYSPVGGLEVNNIMYENAFLSLLTDKLKRIKYMHIGGQKDAQENHP